MNVRDESLILCANVKLTLKYQNKIISKTISIKEIYFVDQIIGNLLEYSDVI